MTLNRNRNLFQESECINYSKKLLVFGFVRLIETHFNLSIPKIIYYLLLLFVYRGDKFNQYMTHYKMKVHPKFALNNNQVLALGQALIDSKEISRVSWKLSLHKLDNNNQLHTSSWYKKWRNFIIYFIKCDKNITINELNSTNFTNYYFLSIYWFKYLEKKYKYNEIPSNFNAQYLSITINFKSKQIEYCCNNDTKCIVTESFEFNTQSKYKFALGGFKKDIIKMISFDEFDWCDDV